MKKVLLIATLLCITATHVRSQSFSVDGLLALSAVPSKNIERFMKKKGFEITIVKSDSVDMQACFKMKLKKGKAYEEPVRSVEISLHNDCKYFTLHTTSGRDYLECEKSLIEGGFFYDTKIEIDSTTSGFFQKGNITIQAIPDSESDEPQYTFILKQRIIPSTVKYAEDLLQFDSHEYLASFFGTQNVKKDLYYFSEKELKKCSVLFSGTKYQVVFVWGDEDNLSNLLYVIVPHSLPTASAEKNQPLTGNSEWQFKSGIYSGMDIKSLLRLNGADFNIYGNESEFAFMVKPEDAGKINFKKTAVVLSCSNCKDIKMFNKNEVSALAVARQDLPMYVNDVIIYPCSK
ncbi:MAG: hypothetical protein ABJB05_13910 [Parafilimonas sp.]